MNRTITKVLIIIFFSVGYISYAQGLIVKGGLNLNTIRGDFSSKYSNLIGAHLGVEWERNIFNSEYWYLAGGTYVDTRGTTVKDTHKISGSGVGITVPVELKVKIPLSYGYNTSYFTAKVGIFSNYIFYQEIPIYYEIDTNSYYFSFTRPKMNGFQSGIRFGIGMDINRFIIDISNDLHISKVLESPTQSNSANYGELYFNAIKLGVGYRF